MKRFRGPKFHEEYRHGKRQRKSVVAKEARIRELVAELSRTDPKSRAAIDLRRKLAKARYQLSIMACVN